MFTVQVRPNASICANAFTKYKDLIAEIEHDGWYLHRQSGSSHMVFRHPRKPGIVVVAGGGKLNRDVPNGTANAIRRQAGLK